MFMFRFKMFGYLTAGAPSNDYKSNNPHHIFYFLVNLLCTANYFAKSIRITFNVFLLSSYELFVVILEKP